MARYELVALDIAEQIVQRKYLLGDRIHGRSTLASLYRVSPETIRKAMAILDNYGIVEVIHGSGIRVVSYDKAREYIDNSNIHHNLLDLVNRMYENIHSQKILIKEMEDLMHEVVVLTRRD